MHILHFFLYFYFFQAFQLLTQELVALETIVLQTLGEKSASMYLKSALSHCYLIFFHSKMFLFMLVTGFEITVDHPHTDVVRCSQLVRGIAFFFLQRFTVNQVYLS